MQVSRRRRVVTPALLLVIALFMAAGCATGVPGAGDGGDRPAQLAGRTFVSESVTEDGQPRPLVPGTQVVLSFPTETQIGAHVGCNHMSGSLQVEPQRLVVGDLTSTEMACTPELGAQDEWLAGLLVANPGYGLDGDRLRLEVDGTVVELVDREVAEPDQPLEGTTWQLDGIVEGDAVSSLPQGTGATVTFGDGGVGVQVEDCNVGSGDATIRGSEIDVGTLMMTLRACEEGPATVEAAVTSVLQGTISYGIDADVLTLTHPSGKGLIFRAGLVKYTMSGGIAGIVDNLTVYANGRAVRTTGGPSGDPGPSERTLAPEELTALVEALEGSDFANLPPYSVDPNIADGFIYEVTYQGRKVTAGTNAVPERLAPVLDELNRVLEGFELVDPPPETPLEGTEWHLERMFDGEVMLWVPEGTGATLVFDGRGVGIRIQNCNQGGGDVTIGETELEIGPLMMTRMACQDGPSIVEAALTSVLQGTISYRIDGAQLTLTHPSGQGLVLGNASDDPATTG